jgi:uridylate kinase
MKNPTIISLGGSLIVPDDVDSVFLSGFKNLLEKEIKNGKEFVVITGGGKICRRYQAAGKAIANLSKDELDWIGVYALSFNAEFVRILFGSLAHSEVVKEPDGLKTVKKPIVIGGANGIGCSTDYDAVLFAKVAGAKRLVNLSNIDFVYDKDPRKYPDAKKIEKISWRDFRKIIPAEWSPRANAPFDPVASREAEKLGLEVAIMNGKNLENFKNYLDGEAFIGSVIV